MIGRPIIELCAGEDTPLYPLTPRFIRENLKPGGKFEGLGYRYGHWLLSDEDVEEIKRRLRPEVIDLDAAPVSGISPRSRTFRNSA